MYPSCKLSICWQACVIPADCLLLARFIRFYVPKCCHRIFMKLLRCLNKCKAAVLSTSSRITLRLISCKEGLQEISLLSNSFLETRLKVFWKTETFLSRMLYVWIRAISFLVKRSRFSSLLEIEDQELSGAIFMLVNIPIRNPYSFRRSMIVTTSGRLSLSSGT